MSTSPGPGNHHDMSMYGNWSDCVKSSTSNTTEGGLGGTTEAVDSTRGTAEALGPPRGTAEALGTALVYRADQRNHIVGDTKNT